MTSTAGVEEHPRSGLPRLDSLTGLRFIAAFVVFISHVAVLLPPSVAASAGLVTTQGYVGVSFFFILSGFVLAWSSRGGDSAAAFYRRRFARVYPSHLVMWVGAGALAAIAGTLVRQADGAGLGLVLLQAWSPDADVHYALNGVAWSLSAEGFFYLLFPLIIQRITALGARRRWMLAILLGVVVLTLALLATAMTSGSSAEDWLWLVYNCPATRALEFAIGVALAVNVRAGFRLPGFRWWLALAAVAYVLCGIWPNPISRVAITLVPFCGLIVSGATRDIGGEGSFFRRRSIVRLGEWSFAFYLVHQLIVHNLVRFNVPSSPVVAFSLVLLAFILSVVGAWALHTIVEVPAERRLRGRTRGSTVRA